MSKEGIQITRIGQVKDDQAASVMLKDNDQQTMLMKKDIIILRNEVTSPVKLTWTTKVRMRRNELPLLWPNL